MSRTDEAARAHAQAGISTVEVVIALPVMFAFLLIIVYLGFYAENVSKVQEAAADAARMASVQNPAGDVAGTARRAAWGDLQGTCNRDTASDLKIRYGTRSIAVSGPGQGATATSIETVEITVTCDLRVLGRDYSITESSYAPLDHFRERP